MKTKFVHTFLGLLAISIWFSFTTNYKVNEFDLDEFSDAKFVVNNYLNTIETYCESYKDEHRFYIEDELLIHPSTYFANDILGLYNSDCEASLYFLNLKENKAKVSYLRDFEIE